MADNTGAAGLPLRQVIAVSAGNALSFYDFVCYAFFAAQIGTTFFPSHDKTTSLLASLATFGVGFFTRPLGAFVIGRMGDRLGRKPAMVLSFGLMGLGILGLALTPSYKAIGVAAPVLFILFRLIQGFALGGEVGPTTAYLIEAAPPLRRGLYVSLAYATQDLGVLCAGVLGTV
ncbi:MAG TPA: MFS transporter, partial [Rhizomicrobium sp.]|nr:MFS transporter [Rhizomicrobium sp.]